MNDLVVDPIPHDSSLSVEVAELIISSLNLDIAAESIDCNVPLYGEGLGLDSIDILEVALVISKRYGIQMRADHADNTSIFLSINTLTAHIAKHRTK